MAITAVNRIPAMTASEKIDAGRSPDRSKGFQDILERSAQSCCSTPPSSEEGRARLEIIKHMARMELMSLNATLVNALGGQGPSTAADSGLGNASSGMLALLQVLEALRVMPKPDTEHRVMDVPGPEPEKPETVKASQNIDDALPPVESFLPADGDLDAVIRWAADKHELDPALIRAVIKTESNFNPKAVSRAGAMGLMQLMPQTAKELGVDDAFDPAANVDGGTRYLSRMLDKYNGDLDRALAAYNWGPGNLDRSTGYLPEETRNYIRIVNQHYRRFADAGSASV
jgi:hypothetical protein